MDSILEAKDISKIYKSGSRELKVLKDIDFQVKAGESLSIIGPSGSGKTTLLGLCAGLDRPSSGQITLCGQSISNMSENEKAEPRNRKWDLSFRTFSLYLL